MYDQGKLGVGEGSVDWSIERATRQKDTLGI